MDFLLDAAAGTVSEEAIATVADVAVEDLGTAAIDDAADAAFEEAELEAEELEECETAGLLRRRRLFQVEGTELVGLCERTGSVDRARESLWRSLYNTDTAAAAGQGAAAVEAEEGPFALLNSLRTTVRYFQEFGQGPLAKLSQNLLLGGLGGWGAWTVGIETPITSHRAGQINDYGQRLEDALDDHVTWRELNATVTAIAKTLPGAF